MALKNIWNFLRGKNISNGIYYNYGTSSISSILIGILVVLEVYLI